MKGLLGEVQRRTAGRSLRQGRPELGRAIRDAASSLARLQPKQSGLLRRAVPTTPVVHEAKRKLIRAALLAGVKPTQVAKHFGVPLTVVREIAADPVALDRGEWRGCLRRQTKDTGGGRSGAG
jgi:hypothetical protein